jgi:hypothetical protein
MTVVGLQSRLLFYLIAAQSLLGSPRMPRELATGWTRFEARIDWSDGYTRCFLARHGVLQSLICAA